MIMPIGVIKARVHDAKALGYDVQKCMVKWGVGYSAAWHFIHEYCMDSTRGRRKPEYENQRILDMQVLDRRTWCEKYGIPLWEYQCYLDMYERKFGEIATPEIRELWEREYWESMA